MFWKNLMVGQNLMVGHALLGGWKWSELPCSVIWHLLVIILMHWVFQFWLWGRFVAEKQTWVLILMSGHRPEMTYYENGEKKVCELDHYTDQSYLGIHYWDLVSKVAYPKLKKNWNSNVQTWETVKIWGDVPPSKYSRSLQEARRLHEHSPVDWGGGGCQIHFNQAFHCCWY